MKVYAIALTRTVYPESRTFEICFYEQPSMKLALYYHLLTFRFYDYAADIREFIDQLPHDLDQIKTKFFELGYLIDIQEV